MNHLRVVIWAFGGMVSVLAFAVSACGDGQNVYIPNGTGGESADAGPDATETNGEGGAGGTSSNACIPKCDGECVPLPPPGFSHPFLFALGSEEVSCPGSANITKTTRFADIKIPHAECDACECAPSTGVCSQPTTITAHAADCENVEGAIATPTNPPASWNGTCASDNALAAAITCAGESCVQSITVGPMGVANDSCTAYNASTYGDFIPAPRWKSYATACQGIATGTCDAALCVPARADGFQLCVERDGIHDCPAENYTKQFVVYDGFSDNRMCEPCSCGTPEGSFCHAWITAYADGACASPVVAGNVWSGGPTCHDVTPPGAAVGAKLAMEPTYHAGTCKPSGGTLSGDVTLTGSRTVCCLA